MEKWWIIHCNQKMMRGKLIEVNAYREGGGMYDNFSVKYRLKGECEWRNTWRVEIKTHVLKLRAEYE